MNYYNNEYTSSRQHPSYSYNRTYQDGLYTHMLLEDFSSSFSITFSVSREDEKFYRVEPNNDKLKNYLSFEDRGFFRYDLDKILQRTMYILLTTGMAHIEIVLWKNRENQIIGISLEPFSAVSVLRLPKQHLFFTQKPDKTAQFFSVSSRHIITLDLKDLGFPRSYFRKLFRRMKPFETNIYSLALKKNKQNIDFAALTKKQDFEFLKLTSRIGWFGRHSSNPNFSEAYLLLRSIRFRTLKKRFLEYLLTQINLGLTEFQTELGFSGQITTAEFDTEHTEIWKNMQEGKCGFSTVSDHVFKI